MIYSRLAPRKGELLATETMTDLNLAGSIPAGEERSDEGVLDGYKIIRHNPSILG